MDIIILLVCSVLSILETVLGFIAYTHVSRTHLRTSHLNSVDSCYCQISNWIIATKPLLSL